LARRTSDASAKRAQEKELVVVLNRRSLLARTLLALSPAPLTKRKMLAPVDGAAARSVPPAPFASEKGDEPCRRSRPLPRRKTLASADDVAARSVPPLRSVRCCRALWRRLSARKLAGALARSFAIE
jgi:hypothetical protein